MRFVGYTINGYRLWDPEEGRIICSRDVKFDETQIEYKRKEDTNHSIYKEIYEEDIDYEEEIQNVTEDDQKSKRKQKEKYETTRQEETQKVIEDKEEIIQEETKRQESGTEKLRTKSGREIKQPRHLQDYEMESGRETKQPRQLQDNEIEHELNVAYCLLTGEPQNF